MGNVLSAGANLVGDVFGGAGKALTPQNQNVANDPGLTQTYQQSQANLGVDFSNQAALAQALLAQSQGQGINLAQAQLQQATDQNAKQGAGMIASQKGINPALAGRQIAMNTAAANQNAAQQGAALQAQTQLGSQQQLGQLYGTMANQNLQNAGSAVSGLTGVNQVNAGTAAQNSAATQATTGGLINKVGMAFGAPGGMAHGGMVTGYADGGPVQKSAAQAIAEQMMGQAAVPMYADGVTAFTKKDSFDPTQIMKMFGSGGEQDGLMSAGAGEGGAAGGMLPMAMMAASHGGQVPGRATFGGDDPVNDTVPAMLSPGEIVVPRSAAGSVAKAKQFVQTSIESENDKEYVLRHPSGSTFRVAKSGLSPEMNGQIQHLYSGSGSVEAENAMQSMGIDQQDPMQSQMPQAAPVQNIAPVIPMKQPSMFDMAKGASPEGVQDTGPTMVERALTPGGMLQKPQDQQNRIPGSAPQSTQTPGPTMPGGEQAMQQPQMGQQQQASGMQQGSGNPYDAVLNKQMALIDQQGKLQAMAQANQAQAYDKYLGDLAQQKQMEDDLTKKHHIEQDQLQASIVNTNIDPNRFWNSKSTGSKVASVIGMLLSGAGSGMAHQNFGPDMVERGIAADIDAQKADLGKKQSLYAMNMQKYRDESQAMLATRAQLMTVASAQMQKQALLDGSPQSLLNSKMMQNQMALEKAKINSQLAQQQVKRAFYGAANQGMEGGMPAEYEGQMRMMDPSTPIARIGKRIYPAVNDKAAEEIRQIEPLFGGIVDGLKELDDLSKAEAKFPGSTAGRAKAIQGSLLADIPKLKSVEVGGQRIPESEIKLAEDYIGDPTKFSQMMTAGPRNKQLLTTLIKEVERKRAANVIGYRGDQITATPGFK